MEICAVAFCLFLAANQKLVICHRKKGLVSLFEKEQGEYGPEIIHKQSYMNYKSTHSGVERYEK